jgi:acetyl-CoA carboxylase biotin carboxyl carrier protein
MDLKLIKSLIDLIAKSEVNEVSIEEGEFKIKIKKAAEIKEASVIYQSPQMAMPQQMMQPVTTNAAAPVSSTEKASEPASNPNHITIKSPMVGTYYKAASPDAPAFVSVGQSIAKGDALCIIEAMKIMNEITSEHTGTIVKVLVDNAQPIEFDQPLFIIDPS